MRRDTSINTSVKLYRQLLIEIYFNPIFVEIEAELLPFGKVSRVLQKPGAELFKPGVKCKIHAFIHGTQESLFDDID